MGIDYKRDSHMHVQGIIKEQCFEFFWSETACLETWPMDLYK
jgi:hypothetical protein